MRIPERRIQEGPAHAKAQSPLIQCKMFANFSGCTTQSTRVEDSSYSRPTSKSSSFLFQGLIKSKCHSVILIQSCLSAFNRAFKTPEPADPQFVCSTTNAVPTPWCLLPPALYTNPHTPMAARTSLPMPSVC